MMPGRGRTAAGASAGGSPGRWDYDAELRLHHEVLRRACRVAPGDQVLDIGCGTGRTTREAASAAGAGRALGTDISGPAIERARELARAEGIRNAAFECADAQVHPFPRERFDLAISRFGTMFFADPVAAFSNIARAMRADGRLVMVVWQAREANEWDVAIRQSLAEPGGPVNLPPPGPDPFSLADQPAARRTLTAAGFASVRFTDVQEPVHYGRDGATALDWVQGFRYTREVLRQLEPAAAARAIGRLREMLAAHLGDDGVWFDSRAWLITARRT